MKRIGSGTNQPPPKINFGMTVGQFIDYLSQLDPKYHNYSVFVRGAGPCTSVGFGQLVVYDNDTYGLVLRND